MATTLLQFWRQQLAIYAAEQTAAQKDLADAQTALAKAKETLDGAPAKKIDGDLEEVAKTGSQIAAKRAELAVADPPDAEMLLDQIVALIIKQRGQQGTVIDDQDDVAAFQAAVEAAAGTLARAKARAARVAATVEAVKSDDTARGMLKTTIGNAPLTTLKAVATAFSASATLTNAKKRIDKNFPAQIVAIANKRRDARVSQLATLQADLDHAADALGTQQANDSGLAGKATQTRIAFERAQDALAAYVATAATRFAQAETVMVALEAIELAAPGTVPDLLTAAEQARVADLAVKGAAAEPTAEDLDKDLNDLFAARSALAAQVLTSIATDVDALGADAQIATKRAAIDTAKTKFKSDLGTFAAANKGDLDLWEAAIPDGAWNVLVQYLGGVAALTDLKGIDPVSLATAMDTAENDYANALGLAQAADRRADYLGDAIGLRRNLLTSARSTTAARLPSAIRGDSY